MRRKTFGELFREKRIGIGFTLRKFCETYHLDPGNISKLERGKLTPPKEEKLKEYAGYLRLKKGKDDWYDFFDKAAADAKRLPKELTEKEVVEKLPLLFRTIKGKKISKAKLDKLIQLVREA